MSIIKSKNLPAPSSYSGCIMYEWNVTTIKLYIHRIESTVWKVYVLHKYYKHMESLSFLLLKNSIGGDSLYAETVKIYVHTGKEDNKVFSIWRLFCNPVGNLYVDLTELINLLGMILVTDLIDEGA